MKTSTCLHILVLFSLVFTLGCATTTVKAPGGDRHEARGLASWYGERYQGRPTASGEPFDPYGFTAAHKTLPFGTRVRVRDVETRKTVVVRINDRGPFVRGRVIDLSYAAARDLGMLRDGIREVELTIIQW